MNIFRRLFSQPEIQKEAAAPPTATLAAPAEAVAEEPPAIEPIALGTAAGGTGTLIDPRLYADGVTRPLPPEPILPYANSEHLVFGQLTDVGIVRSNNQDAAISFFSTGRSADERPDFGFFAVADGMGGHHDGEKASAVTIRTVAREITNTIYLPIISGDEEAYQIPIIEMLADAVHKANLEVLTQVPEGGTTVTAVMLIGNLAYIVHVGDSRVYLVSRDGMEQITRDHSLVQRLIELDQLTLEEAVDHPQKNVLYRALGQSESLEVDTLTRRLPPRSRLLICSDGLWNQVDEKEVQSVVRQHADPQEACEKLIALANSNGGIDNVTAILLHIPG
jgi:PPM family protein phosphatase